MSQLPVEVDLPGPCGDGECYVETHFLEGSAGGKIIQEEGEYEVDWFCSTKSS